MKDEKTKKQKDEKTRRQVSFLSSALLIQQAGERQVQEGQKVE